MNMRVARPQLNRQLLLIIIVCSITGYASILEAANSGQTSSIEISVDALILRLTDVNGEPVERAKVGSWTNWSDTRLAPERALVRFVRGSNAVISLEDGTVVLKAKRLFENLPADKAIPLYAYHEDRKIGGLIQVSRKHLGKRIDLKMEPVCHIKGQLACSGLKELDLPLEWTNVYVYWGNLRPFQCSSNQQRFEFYLPPGQYKLRAYGTRTYSKEVNIDIKPGQHNLELSIDLSADKLATLFGKPAPEFRRIKGWKNGGPVKLADFRGKVVLLEFWGYWCGPCVREMPRLMELHDAFSDKGLVIIAVHNDTADSIEEMDSKLANIRKKYWDGQDLPFLVALDGGGTTKIKGTNETAKGATTATYGVTSFATTVLIDREGRVVKQFYPSSRKHRAELERMLWVNETGSRKIFEQTYHIEEGEVLKRIEPRFVELRCKFLEESVRDEPESYYTTIEWTEKPALLSRRPVMREVSLKTVFEKIIGLSKFDYEGPIELLEIDLSGDWIVRKHISMEKKVKALEKIVQKVTGRPIRFERRSVKRDVIVVRGQFEFHPLSGTYNDTWVHVFSDKLDPDEGGGGGSGSLDKFLNQRLAVTQLNRQVINLSESSDDVVLRWGCHMSGYLGKMPSGPESAAKLDLLLKNLARQTSLTFTKERRKVDVWYLVDANSSRKDF